MGIGVRSAKIEVMAGDLELIFEYGKVVIRKDYHRHIQNSMHIGVIRNETLEYYIQMSKGLAQTVEKQ
jgi:hypothetical protein